MSQIFPVLLGTLADDKQSDEVCSYGSYLKYLSSEEMKYEMRLLFYIRTCQTVTDILLLTLFPCML